jgi:hypothetical protein
MWMWAAIRMGWHGRVRRSKTGMICLRSIAGASEIERFERYGRREGSSGSFDCGSRDEAAKAFAQDDGIAWVDGEL